MKYFVIIFCVLVLAITITFFESREESIPVTGEPVNFHVVLDAGHGGRDRGASANGVFESDINLSIVMELRREFISRGATVTLTRTNTESLANPLARNQKRSCMEARVRIVENANPDLVISIHLNTYPSPRVRGLQAFHQRNNNVSRDFAWAIQNEINNTTFPMSRHPKPGDFYILNEVTAPAVLIECGFLTNPDDARLLTTIEYQRFLAYHIAKSALRHADEV